MTKTQEIPTLIFTNIFKTNIAGYDFLPKIMRLLNFYYILNSYSP